MFIIQFSGTELILLIFLLSISLTIPRNCFAALGMTYRVEVIKTNEERWIEERSKREVGREGGCADKLSTLYKMMKKEYWLH